MAQKNQIRMNETTFAVMAVLVIAALIGAFTGWFGMTDTPTGAVTAPTEPQQPLQLIPAIEKTNVYLSAFNLEEYERRGQKNWVEGEVMIIKDGIAIGDAIPTSEDNAVKSTQEFNGGDVISIMGNAPGFYAGVTEDVTIDRTLQPIEVFLLPAEPVEVFFEDNRFDPVVDMTIAPEEVSRLHSLVLERPGNRNAYQFCGIAAKYDDSNLELRLGTNGQLAAGITNLEDKYDYYDNEGFDAVWEFDRVIKNFEELKVNFAVEAKSSAPEDTYTIEFEVFDCEYNFQQGKFVYTSEDRNEQPVGLDAIPLTFDVVVAN